MVPTFLKARRAQRAPSRFRGPVSGSTALVGMCRGNAHGSIDVAAQIDLLLKLKMEIRARPGNRAGLLIGEARQMTYARRQALLSPHGWAGLSGYGHCFRIVLSIANRFGAMRFRRGERAFTP
jgi:hypothetical protein